MATISSRLTSTGTMLVNGTIDEVTYNSSAGNTAIINKSVYSQNLTGTGWTGYSRTVTSNYAYAPDGSLTASRVLESTDAVNTIHGFGQSQTNYVAGNRYTISFYMKSYSADRAFIFGVGAEVTGGVVGTNYVYAYCDPDLGTIRNSLVYAPAAQTTAVTNIGNGWYRFSLSFLAANSVTKGVDIQFQGGAGKNQQTYIGNGTSGILIWGLQIEVGSTPTDYQPIAAANVLVAGSTAKQTPAAVYTSGQFDEVTFNATSPAYVNMASYSQALTNSVWSSITRATITGTTYTAPDGTATASKIADTIGSGSGYLRRYYSFSSNTYYTYSVYAKAGEWSYAWIVNFTDNNAFFGDYVNFNLSTGALATNSNSSRMLNPTIVPVGNGWYRISVTCSTRTLTVESTGGIIAVGPSIDQYGGTGPGDGTSGIYIWGVQTQLGNVATIYQPIAAANTLVSSTTVQKIDNTGGYYTQGQLDEFTGAPVVDSNLKIWYDAGQTASYPGTGTTVTDLSGNGNNGTLGDGGRVGGTGTPVFVTSIPSFTGNGNSQIGFANASSINSSTTFTLNWMGSFNGFNTGDEYNNIVSLRENYAVNGYRFGANTAGYAVFWTQQTGGNIRIASNTIMTTNNTYNLCVTYDGTTARMYQNANLVASQVGTYIPLQAYSGWVGGSNEGCIGANMKYSTFQWYHRALTSDEVAQNFNALRRRYNI